MDCAEIKAEMAEDGLLEPLIITEEGDVTEGVNEREAASSMAVIIQSCSGESSPNKEEECAGEKRDEENIVREISLKEQNLENHQAEQEENLNGEVVVYEKDKQEETENINDGQSTDDTESISQMDNVTTVSEKPERPSDTEDEDTQSDPQVDKRLNSSEQQPDGTQGPEEDSNQVCKLLFSTILVPCDCPSGSSR